MISNKSLYIFILTALLAFLDFTCMAQPKNGNAEHKYKYSYIVAKDGSGEFRSIQEAINDIIPFPYKEVTIYVKNGVYNEKIELPSWNTNVSLIGESVDKTIITFNDYYGRGKTNTFTSYTAKICGNDFHAENITFINSAGAVGQAVALHVEADRCVFKNCRFIGNQDTMYTAGENSRQYFVDCYIEGTTDFIFGPATAVFQNCTIHSKSNSFITAANTPEGNKFGYVFIDCKLTADPSVDKVYLGRPWRSFAKTVFIRCDLGEHILPEGWHNWSSPESEQTVLYAEYKCVGPSANRSGRVKWAKELSDKEVKNYTLENIFSGGRQAVSSEKEWYQQKINNFTSQRQASKL